MPTLVCGVQGADDGVPVEIGEIGGGDAEERGGEAGIEAWEAVGGKYFGEGVEGGGVVL